MPDTFFTSSPHWGWYIVFYFFIGGIAGGCFFISSLLYLFGRPEDRSVVRLGYYVALAGALVSGALLTLDLTKPLRFWHMLVQSNTGGLMFKAWSPMSVGAWGLLFFGFFAALATLGALAEEGKLPWGPKPTLAGPLGALVAVAGSGFGFFLAGYTGVLLSVTNRPIWADSNWLGALFLFSAASTGAAALVLLSRWRGDGHPESIAWLTRLDRAALTLELLALIALIVSLGSVARVLIGPWGLVLVLGVAGAGIIVPFALESRPDRAGRNLVRAAALVLVGGFLLRVAVIFASDPIYVLGSGIAN